MPMCNQLLNSLFVPTWGAGNCSLFALFSDRKMQSRSPSDFETGLGILLSWQLMLLRGFWQQVEMTTYQQQSTLCLGGSCP